MLHPLTQSMTTNEGDTLDVTVEFCAEPNYTKVVWMSEERVYLPGGELRDGVRALPIEVRYFLFSYFNFILLIQTLLLFSMKIKLDRRDQFFTTHNIALKAVNYNLSDIYPSPERVHN